MIGIGKGSSTCPIGLATSAGGIKLEDRGRSLGDTEVGCDTSFNGIESLLLGVIEMTLAAEEDDFVLE